MAKANILVVEDDGIVAKDIKDRLEKLGFTVSATVPSGEEALEKIKEHKPDLVLMDIMLKGEMDGIEAAEQIRSRFNIPVVYLTAYADEKVLEAAKLAEPFGYLMKPFVDRELKAVIEIALYRYKMEMKLKENEERFMTIFENAPVLIDSFDKDGRCILWNKECEKTFGWTMEEINACDNPLSLFYPDTDIQEQVRGSVTLTPEGVFTEWHPMTKDGSELVTLWSNFRFPDETIINLGYDITEDRKAEGALRESEERYKQFFTSISDAIIIFDLKTGEIVEVNDTACEWYGYGREEFCRLTVDDVSAEPEKSVARIKEMARRQQTRIPLRYNRKKDGTIFPVEISTGIFKGGNRSLGCGIFRDLTEKKLANDLLVESEQKYRNLIMALNEGVWAIDQDAYTTFVNPRMAEVLGYTEEEMEGKHLFSFMDDRGVELAKENLERRQQGIKEHHDFEFLRKDGIRMYASLETSPIMDAEGNYAGAIAGVVDITERVKVEEALRDTNVQLQSLADRLEEMDESHRRRTAKELHDRTAQNLSAVSINLSMIKLLLPPEEIAKVDQRLEDSQELLNDAVMHIRDVMAELHPVILDDYGLMAALRWLGDQFSERTGVHAVVKGEDLPSKLPQKKERAIFRIAQEALMNIAKHAMASEVIVALEEINGSLRLVISDDGVGFDTEVVKSSKEPHWGLAIMKERIIAVQGELNVESMPEKGTRIIAQLRK